MSYYPTPAKIVEKCFDKIHEQIYEIYEDGAFEEESVFITECLNDVYELIEYIKSGEYAKHCEREYEENE